jgi:nucleoside-diphosphate-sugar epimerase
MNSVIENKSSLLITGATSQIGHFLLPRLISNGFNLLAISRKAKAIPPIEEPNVKWLYQDITRGLDVKDIDRCATLIHIAPLFLLPDIIDSVSQLGVNRIIAFSSTSVFSKKDSPSPVEKETARKLMEAERSLQEQCERLSITWTLFRPTMIYGCGLDKNITTIANFIRRFGFFPLAGEGKGLRQPVHADDLAQACLTALNTPLTFNRAYNLSGGETLTYRHMVDKIFIGLGKKPRTITIPIPFYRAALNFIGLIKPDYGMTAEMADRMNSDLCFDHSDAKRDFGYSPKGFTFE